MKIVSFPYNLYEEHYKRLEETAEDKVKVIPKPSTSSKKGK